METSVVVLHIYQSEGQQETGLNTQNSFDLIKVSFSYVYVRNDRIFLILLLYSVVLSKTQEHTFRD